MSRALTGTNVVPFYADRADYVVRPAGGAYVAEGRFGNDIDYRDISFQDVLDKVWNDWNGVTIALTRGTFVVAAGEKLEPPNDTKLFGAGTEQTVIQKVAEAGANRPIELVGERDVTIRDMTIEYTDNSIGDGRAIWLEDAQDILIENVLFKDFSLSGIFMRGVTNFVRVNRCRAEGFQDTSGGAFIDVFFDTGSVDDIWVTNNIILGNRGLLYVDTNADTKGARWHINHNYCKDIKGDVIAPRSFDNTEIMGNIIIESANTNIMNGIDIRAGKWNTVVGNTLIMTGTDTTPANPARGIFAGHGCTHSLIADNAIYGYTGGITFYGASECVMSGNVVSDCTAYGINVSEDVESPFNADRNLVVGNSSFDNGTYGFQIDDEANYNRFTGNFTHGNGTACFRIAHADCTRNIITDNSFDEGNISDVGGGHGCVAYLNWDPSAGAFITTINAPAVVGGGGGALP